MNVVKCIKLRYKSSCFTEGKEYVVDSEGMTIDDEGDRVIISDVVQMHEFATIFSGPEAVETGASKNDTKDKKLKYRFVHQTLIDECSKSMMAGEIKYGAYNYLKGHEMNQLLDAAVRHIKQYQEGENIDKDTTAILGMDVTHLGCALANINMLLIQQKHGTLKDDRPIIGGVIQDELEL